MRWSAIIMIMAALALLPATAPASETVKTFNLTARDSASRRR